jgi:hypothetical protein
MVQRLWKALHRCGEVFSQWLGDIHRRQDVAASQFQRRCQSTIRCFVLLTVARSVAKRIKMGTRGHLAYSLYAQEHSPPRKPPTKSTVSNNVT